MGMGAGSCATVDSGRHAVMSAGRRLVSGAGVRGGSSARWRAAVGAIPVIVALLLGASAAPARSLPSPIPASPVPAVPGAAVVTVYVDAATAVGPLDRALVGFGWHEGGAPLSAVEPLHPRLIRIDASLEQVSSGHDEPLALAPLLARVAEVRAIGGEPLVILSYLPAWLGEPVAYGRDPTRVRPADLDAWERVVHDVVRALATAPAPALRFEAWNEPDVPLFWQDTPSAWADTVERSGRAVATVEQETGLDLAFGGPATAVPDPVYLAQFLDRFRDPALPLDFVSWHYYGNYPFFGPDGAEFPITEPIQPLLGRPNPIASPAAFGPQVDFMRKLTEAALAGSGRPLPALVIDEWNLSAAGFDLRHDTASGAAFVAGVLTEMQVAGLDAAAFFRANDTRGVPGEHGTVQINGSRKPVWWAFDLWQRQAGTVVATTGAGDPNDDLWVLATADGTHVTVLLSTFRADANATTPITVRVQVAGRTLAAMGATVWRIDLAHPGGGAPEQLTTAAGSFTVAMPVPGVALVEIPIGRRAVPLPAVIPP